MGRKRRHIDPAAPLPRGLQKWGLVYRARRRPSERWVSFGTDYVAALAGFRAWKCSNPVDSTAHLLDTFVGRVCTDRVAAKTMAPRTARDYARDAPELKRWLGHIPYRALSPKHVSDFRDQRGVRAPSHVRNEMALLSAALSWGVEKGMLPGNVAMQVARPSRRVRERLISDTEYLKVYEHAVASVRLAMVLCVRTLALPGDALKLGPRNVRRHDDGRKTLAFRRGKTNVLVEVEIVGELAEALAPVMGTAHPTFVRREDGLPYTVDGIGAMFRRYVGKAFPRESEHAPGADFGLRDLRAKGATEMYRADPNNIRQIQLLLGHKSVRTTEIYIKGLVTEIVRPNEVPIIAAVE